MKKNILLFILLLFGGCLVAQDLEVVKFSPCELVRTKNFANLILGEDSTGTSSKPSMSFLFSKNLAHFDTFTEDRHDKFEKLVLKVFGKDFAEK